jgi:hypothetical protein
MTVRYQSSSRAEKLSFKSWWLANANRSDVARGRTLWKAVARAECRPIRLRGRAERLAVACHSDRDLRVALAVKPTIVDPSKKRSASSMSSSAVSLVLLENVPFRHADVRLLASHHKLPYGLVGCHRRAPVAGFSRSDSPPWNYKLDKAS